MASFIKWLKDMFGLSAGKTGMAVGGVGLLITALVQLLYSFDADLTTGTNWDALTAALVGAYGFFFNKETVITQNKQTFVITDAKKV